MTHDRSRISVDAWIGAGGWGYFHGPSGKNLVDYARGFGFVEVNSTFYRHPPREAVRRWRGSVPAGFRFAVKGHRSITHVHRFRATRGALAALARDAAIARTLDSDILVLETPADLEFGREETDAIAEFAGTVGRRVRIALEARAYAGTALPDPLSRALNDVSGIDVVDLSRGILPRVDSDILYSRVFGKGPHNVWELSDDELREIDAASRTTGSDRMVFAFHGVRMYKDAARFLEFRSTGALLPATKGQGTLAIAEALAPDARFPLTRNELLRDHGWKVVTAEDGRNVHASEYLARLPHRTFRSLDEALRSIPHPEAGSYILPASPDL